MRGSETSTYMFRLTTTEYGRNSYQRKFCTNHQYDDIQYLKFYWVKQEKIGFIVFKKNLSQNIGSLGWRQGLVISTKNV